jgi:hypothetical protein
MEPEFWASNRLVFWMWWHSGLALCVIMYHLLVQLSRPVDITSREPLCLDPRLPELDYLPNTEPCVPPNLPFHLHLELQREWVAVSSTPLHSLDFVFLLVFTFSLLMSQQRTTSFTCTDSCNVLHVAAGRAFGLVAHVQSFPGANRQVQRVAGRT